MRTLYRHAALATATGPDLRLEQSLLVVDGTIHYLGHDDEAPEPGSNTRVIDAGGATIVPGLVDAHSHTVLPGGSHWIERVGDPEEELRRVGEHNGEIAFRAGVRWFRDVGSPRRGDRALALDVRDEWVGRNDRPYIRAAGTWIGKSGMISDFVGADDADSLVAAVESQIADGADLIKLYLDGPESEPAPWSADEVARAVAAATEAGVTVTAHATNLPAARSGVLGGVHCIEHGTRLDQDLVAEMERRGTYVVPTLAVMKSWETFAATTEIERFTSRKGRRALRTRMDDARESVQLARVAGVRIAAGSDFGGGSLRANQLAWEVEALVDAGLEAWEALGAATRVGGDLLDEPEAGRLRDGGPADFFLVHGNPLTDPTALWRVWRSD